MRILGFGTYDVRLHPRVGVLLEGLRERGFAVREVDEPLGVGTAQRVKSLTSPASALRFAAAIAGKWARLIRRTSAYRGKNRPDAVLVGYLGHFDVVLARVLFPRTPIVLDHLIFASDTAKDRGLSGGGVVGRLAYRLLEGIDRAALAAADVVVLDTDDHRALLPARARGKEAVVPVGAPKRWFDAGDRARRVRDEARRAEGEAPAPAENARTPESEARKAGNGEDDGPLSVVFFGLFTPLQGAPTIARALAILEDRGVRIDVTLIGDGQDAKAVREALPSGESVRVSWIDWVDSEDLPDVVAGHDVCLGIFGTSGKARRVVPNKVYQGIAAGCVVVTSDTPPQRRILGGGARFVEPGDAPALADALQALAQERPWDRERSRARRRPEGEVSRGQFGGDGAGRSADGAGLSVDSAGHSENVRVPADQTEPALNQTEPALNELEAAEIREGFRAVRVTDSLARAILGMGRRRLRNKRERLDPKRVSAERKRGIPGLKRMRSQRPARGNGGLSSPGERE